MKIIANPGSLYNSRTLKKNSSALWGRSSFVGGGGGG